MTQKEKAEQFDALLKQIESDFQYFIRRRNECLDEMKRWAESGSNIRHDMANSDRRYFEHSMHQAGRLLAFVRRVDVVVVCECDYCERKKKETTSLVRRSQ